MKPLELIEAIRNSFIGSVSVYTNGSCYKFYLILKSVWPQANAWYAICPGHVYTEIDGRFYDIEGEHQKDPKWIQLKDEPKIYQDAPNWIWSLDYHTTQVQRNVKSLSNQNRITSPCSIDLGEQE